VRVPYVVLDGRTAHATFVQHLPSQLDRLDLGAPIAVGNATQIIGGILGTDARLDLDEKRFERHVGYVTTHGVDQAAREEARRLTGQAHALSGNLIYLRGDDAKDPLDARIVTSRDRARNGLVIIAAVFGAIVVALLVALKRLRHAATVERADALLAADIDRGSPT
jgi:hypothetical protein